MQVTLDATPHELVDLIGALATGQRSLHRTLGQIFHALTTVSQQELQMNADLQAKFDALTKQVADDTSVTNGAVTLLTTLNTEIAALKSTTTDPTVLAAIDTLTGAVASQTKTLADAVAANTPAAAV